MEKINPTRSDDFIKKLNKSLLKLDQLATTSARLPKWLNYIQELKLYLNVLKIKK